MRQMQVAAKSSGGTAEVNRFVGQVSRGHGVLQRKVIAKDKFFVTQSVKGKLKTLAKASAIAYVKLLVKQYGCDIPGQKAPAGAEFWCTLPQYSTMEDVYVCYVEFSKKELKNIAHNPAVSSQFYPEIAELYAELALQNHAKSTSVIDVDEEPRVQSDFLNHISTIDFNILIERHVLHKSTFLALFARRRPTQRGLFFNVRFPDPGKWTLGLCGVCEDYKYIVANVAEFTQIEMEQAREISLLHIQRAQELRNYLNQNVARSVMEGADTISVGFDCAAALQLPSDPRKEHLRDSRVSLPIFGFEEHWRTSSFVLHTGQYGKGANLIISLFLSQLKSLLLKRKVSNVPIPRRLTIQMDNCGSENKNRLGAHVLIYIINIVCIYNIKDLFLKFFNDHLL
jgi:hypothetical protein